MTFGYSRDDAEGGFLLKYVEDKILPVNPFQTLDDAVAGLMKIAVDKGRSTKQGLARVPDGTIFDGYDVGLLPWMGIGTWLIPIGGFVAAIASAATVWLARAPMLARLATAPALLVVGFWLLLVLVAMAPRSAVP